MNRIGWTMLVTACLAFALSAHAQRTDDSSAITVIQGATVIDGISSAPIKDAVIVVEGDTIRNIGKRGSFQIPSNARTINAAGKTIIPGIFNDHGHIAMVEGFETKPANYNRARLQRDANTYLYYGVTNMLSLGMDREAMVGLKADQRSGKADGARIYSAGLGFAAKDGWEPEGVKDINRPTTTEEARVLVRKEVQKGDDIIKIWVDDDYGRLPKITPELYGAIIDEAHRNGKKVFAHLIKLEDARELVRRGLDALAHSIRDNEVDAEYIKLAKEKGVTQVADLVGHRASIDYAEGAAFLRDPGLPGLFPPEVLRTLATKDYQQKFATSPTLARTRREYDLAAKNMIKLAAAGIPIVVGTDSGDVGHFQGLWEHREMELMVKAGLTPMQAIRAATINGARLLGVDKRLGSLEAGKVADFIVLNADPLSDITNTLKIDSVWMNGRQVDRNSLKSYPLG